MPGFIEWVLDLVSSVLSRRAENYARDQGAKTRRENRRIEVLMTKPPSRRDDSLYFTPCLSLDRAVCSARRADCRNPSHFG